MMRRAEAPSEIWLELPAVILPSGLKAGFRLARDSGVVSGRMPSSAVTMPSPLMMLPVSLSRRISWIGTISRSKRPSAVASRGPLLGLGAEGVEVLAGEAPLVGDHVGADALRHEAGSV